MPADELKARALRHVARREHSREELRRKLAPHGEPDAVEAVLDRLAELDLLSDVRFADAFVRGRVERFGRRRLQQELTQRGVAAETIDEVLSGTSGDDELQRAALLWRRKFGHAPADAREWARQARFLTARGFAADVVRKVLKARFDEPA